MSLVRKLLAWWRGRASRSERAEGEQARERIAAQRAETVFDALRKQGM